MVAKEFEEEELISPHDEQVMRKIKKVMQQRLNRSIRTLPKLYRQL